MEIGVSFGTDELPAAPGDVCSRCNAAITEAAHHTYVQVGNPQKSEYTGHKYCEVCYVREFGEESD